MILQTFGGVLGRGIELLESLWTSQLNANGKLSGNGGRIYTKISKKASSTKTPSSDRSDCAKGMTSLI